MAQMLFDIAVLLSDGVKYTLGIFVVTIIGSMPLGLLLTFLRMNKSRGGVQHL